jgi:hypothetical protein
MEMWHERKWNEDAGNLESYGLVYRQSKNLTMNGGKRRTK